MLWLCEKLYFRAGKSEKLWNGSSLQPEAEMGKRRLMSVCSSLQTLPHVCTATANITFFIVAIIILSVVFLLGRIQKPVKQSFRNTLMCLCYLYLSNKLTFEYRGNKLQCEGTVISCRVISLSSGFSHKQQLQLTAAPACPYEEQPTRFQLHFVPIKSLKLKTSLIKCFTLEKLKLRKLKLMMRNVELNPLVKPTKW